MVKSTPTSPTKELMTLEEWNHHQNSVGYHAELGGSAVTPAMLTQSKKPRDPIPLALRNSRRPTRFPMKRRSSMPTPPIRRA